MKKLQDDVDTAFSELAFVDAITEGWTDEDWKALGDDFEFQLFCDSWGIRDDESCEEIIQDLRRQEKIEVLVFIVFPITLFALLAVHWMSGGF